MKTVYLPVQQYLPGRHDSFLKTIVKHFNVIMPASDRFDLDKRNITFAETIVKPADNVDKTPEFKKEWDKYISFVQNEVKKISHQPVSNSEITAYLEKQKKTVIRRLMEALLFNSVAKQTKIDFVVASSDYAQQSRPVVFSAKQLGITTVNIDHGLFGTMSYPTIFKKKPNSPRYISDYVILDNNLEVDIISKYASPLVKSRYLPLGTPIDTSQQLNRHSPEEAKTVLGINPEPVTLTLILSWNEPNSPLGLVKLYTEEIHFVQSVLKILNSFHNKNEIQLIIKLHPTIADFGELSSYTRLLNRIVTKAGFEHCTFITSKNLNLVLEASDILLAWKESSVLWDGIMQGKLVAQMPGETLKTLYADNDLNSHNPLARAGLFQFITSDSQLKKLFETALDTNWKEQNRKRLNDFKQEWNLTYKSALEKSEIIANWLNTA
jgi:hypothetical protein